jgi:thymidylate synthase
MKKSASDPLKESISGSEAIRVGYSSVAANADAAYRNVLRDVLESNDEVVGDPSLSVGSGKRSKEILHYNIRIKNPRERLIWNKLRRIDLPAAVARFVWMMGGNDRLEDISFYQPKVDDFSDDKIIVPGSCYGRRMIYPSPGCNQIDGIIKRLQKEPATRRATIAVYAPEDAVRESVDIPCTFGLAFHNRGNILYPTVIMRSNNAFILLPYNIFEFSLLSEAIAVEVGLEIGAMSYHALSMHVYASNYEAAAAVVGAPDVEPISLVPKMPDDPKPMVQIKELIRLEAEARHAASGFCDDNFESVWVAQAETRLVPYWRQFYYLLLFAMCKKVNYKKGLVRLREFIDDPWLNYLPPKVSTPLATAAPITAKQIDLFIGNRADVNDGKVQMRQDLPERRDDSTVLSREDLERELDEVLAFYKPTIAEDQWQLVVDYRTEFIEQALVSPTRANKAVQQLRKSRFSVEKGHAVLNSRGPAKPLITRLRQMLR